MDQTDGTQRKLGAHTKLIHEWIKSFYSERCQSHLRLTLESTFDWREQLEGKLFAFKGKCLLGTRQVCHSILYNRALEYNRSLLPLQANLKTTILISLEFYDI